MRVLQIGASSVKGGVESFLINYNKELKKYGIIFDYVSEEGSLAYEEEIIELKGKIYKGLDRRNPITYFMKLFKVTKKYNIVHINMLSAANILPLLACKINGVSKVIVHSHNAGTEKWYRYVLHYINKWMIALVATDYWTCSDLAARWMYPRYIYKKEKCLYVKNAIRYDKYKFKKECRDRIRKELQIDDETIVIGNVGRVTKQKNIFFLLNVIKILSEKKHNILFLHVGAYDFGYREVIDRQIKHLGIGKYVLFIGEISNANEYYSAFDVFCMPSLYEGLSFTAIEAQCSGVKCLFSNTMSKETDFTCKSLFLPIDNCSVWVDNIIKKPINRLDSAYIKLKLLKSGFDITHESKRLASMYKTERNE